MNREAFESQYADDWGRLGKLLDRLEASGSRRHEPVRAGEFPELYRRVCHHLALARVRRYGTDLE